MSAPGRDEDLVRQGTPWWKTCFVLARLRTRALIRTTNDDKYHAYGRLQRRTALDASYNSSLPSRSRPAGLPLLTLGRDA